ncbi:TraB/GumN family protein [Tenacibaculum finnmarkense genomovar finnmarkense]|nr:TraB/GumN family protein [Tenacibaculum finnmarkense]MBE7693735.1 hypothetical protein [Tenacibaculum finnmarkense genomovar finnmarkense]MCD8403863.1 TraB/GumN family protein [Tenacibaculum finnmarkense genomovar finnmarkense]MCD8418837.1 TraB/GumN family protein [Tenacibaculum finnmarkense genomovar finnmarkense]MCD8423596.1 TraB/GumN family protein [Tenacibaculum finnmarkense genomovar ulcerans]MCG8187135.1 TraB/GumN family protein [Tenacibaculum finnmarkense genomovar finnmarkense]
MKKILLQILILILLTSCSNQEQIKFDKGILWEIESKSGIKSYIYGTIHLYPKTEIQISEKVFSKIENCKTLALEIDSTNEKEQKKLSNFQMPEYLLESYKIIISEYGNELVSMEDQFIKKARSANVNIFGLESVDEIISILKRIKNLKISDDIFIMDEMLVDYRKSLVMYNEESIEDIKESMKIQMGDEITKMLIDERNENWIKNINLIVEKESTFIAIGIGHLGGEKGILNLLIENGFKLERIEL